MRHPITVLMIVLGVTLLGVISLGRLGIDLFPEMAAPRLYVELQAGERPPEEIERQFIESLEDLVFRQKGVTGVTSTVRVGAARVAVEYAWDRDMDEAFLELQKVAADFGQNADLDGITITQHDPNSDPIMTVALMNPEIGDMDVLRRTAENYIRNELVRIEGIAGVEIAGGEEAEVLVETDEYLLEAYGLSVDQIAQAIGSYNADASSGTITEMGIEYLIRSVGSFESIDDIGSLVVAWKERASTAASEDGRAPGRTPVHLSDVARVGLKSRDPRNIVRLDGARCVGLSIFKEVKYNTVRASRDLRRGIARLEGALPGYELRIVQDQGLFIDGAIGEVRQTALVGVLLAVLVLYVFLRRIGTTAIISVSIPVSILATFNLMYFNGLSLNIMTLGGLALGAGMLVDNAIVVVENIVRSIEAGMGPREAAAAGASEVGGAISASTITTVVVFLPIVYLHGTAGALFKDQAWTVAFSLISSLAVAVLVIPMLAGRFLRGTGRAEAKRSVQFRRYGALLERALDRKGIVAGAAALLVAAAALLIPVIGSEFIPSADADEYSIRLSLPEGTELSRTDGTIVGLEEAVRAVFPGAIETIYSTAGPVGGLVGDENSLFEDENSAVMRIRFRRGHGLSDDRIMAGLGSSVAGLPGVRTRIAQDQTALPATLGTSEAPVVVEISGEEIETLASLAAAAKERMSEVEDLYNVETSVEGGRPEVNIVVDRLRAGMLEVGLTEVASSLEDRLSGRVAGDWEDDGERRDITLKLPDASLGDLERSYVSSGERRIRLDELASIEIGSAPREIIRTNQVRSVLVTAHKREGRPFDHAIADIRGRLAVLDLPDRYSVGITGAEAKRRAEFADLRFALILSVVLVYMVLAAQFESLLHPFVILLTIPLAGVGGILIFLVLGRPLNIMAYIGLIMLAGIAVNDSIILVDAINRLRRGGLAAREAIVEAGRM
ncbi:MAG: efflux RND transporter permease subunit, partial [Candidatus Krumholzibacteria bacterium]|nr:efflux RND transporter permease subunit [Candidatus Krumholzibacteria bacterium]